MTKKSVVAIQWIDIQSCSSIQSFWCEHYKLLIHKGKIMDMAVKDKADNSEKAKALQAALAQ
ncbi:MAG: hypothetical protein KDF56_04065, partial [Ottowia sp.]|nr:hypothetical protein [Ottowia sp.]